MKSIKMIMAAFVMAAFAMAATVQAGPGNCCKKAQDEKKECTHKCCVEAAKENKWCTKCGGEGEKPKKEEKKEEKKDK